MSIRLQNTMKLTMKSHRMLNHCLQEFKRHLHNEDSQLKNLLIIRNNTEKDENDYYYFEARANDD